MNDEMEQLFDERDQLRAENARLREALTSVLDGLGALTKRHELLNYVSEEEAKHVWASLDDSHE